MRGGRLVTVLGALALGTACGDSLHSKAGTAMAGCLAIREPLFTAGQADRALATPLSAVVDSLAVQTAYKVGLVVYQQVAGAAETQAELTCALELGSRYDNADTREWLRTFLRHPNAPVVQQAQRLLDKQGR